MKIEEGSIITLDDGKSYIVVDIIKYNNLNYVYLCSAQKPIRIELANISEDNNGDFQVEILTDVEQKSRIYGMFLDSFRDETGSYRKVG